MKFNVHGGHNFIVPGAGGCFSETKEDRNVKNLVITKLKALGHTVYDCTDESGSTQSKNLVNIVNKCNAHSVDLDISIHFNASNGVGHGTEVLIYSDGSKAKPYAQKIVNSIADLGFANRGVKTRTNLYVLKRTNSPSLLVECCFCDNQGDANLYSAEKMADAIVKGILGKTTEVKQNTNTTSASKPAQSTSKSYLSQGDKGDAVKTMQTMLIACGYSCGKYGADGDFGTGSKNALKAFQKDYGLTIDGKYGNNSKAKLESVYNAKTKKRSTKDLIKDGQQHGINFTGHKISVDGIWGTETKKQCIRVIQHAMNLDYKVGLTVDGIWGTKSEKAAGTHYVKRGETQYLVTALEIIMYCKGKDPGKVECPGIYGSGLTAVAGEKVTVKQMYKLL